MVYELTNQDLLEVNGGGSVSEWFGNLMGSFALGAAIGSAAGPGGAVVGGIAGAAVGNALYALAVYYDNCHYC